MDLKKLASTWKEYQKWLKQEGITKDNIQEKLPSLVQSVKQNPEKLQQLKDLLNDSTVLSLAKKFNIGDSDIQQMKSVLDDNSNTSKTPTRNGNLTREQMDMLRKFKSK